MNFGPYPMVNGLTRLDSRFLGEPARVGDLKRRIGEDLDAAAAAEAGLVTFTPDDIDWDDEVRIAVEERAAFSPDALTGMESSLRFGGPETLESKIFARLSAWQNWIFQRPNAVGPKGALKVYGSGRAQRVRPEESVMAGIDYVERIPNNVNLAENRRLQRALEDWQPKFLDWWQDMGPGRLPGQGRVPAHRDQRGRRRAGPSSATRRCRTTAGASSSPSPSRTARSTSATTWASPRGRRCPASTAASCAG